MTDYHIGADQMIESFSRRAKELVHGMQHRVQRTPDIADFRAAFEDELLVMIRTGTSSDNKLKGD